METPPNRFVVEVSDVQHHVRIDPAAVRSLVASVLEGEGVDAATVSVALVDDAAIHRVNRTFLDHDCPTDVVSFVLSEAGEPLVGELVVSTETAARVAGELGAPCWNELALYLVHGSLHLCGCDDLDESAAAVMRAREDAALTRVGLSNPFPLGRRKSD